MFITMMVAPTSTGIVCHLIQVLYDVKYYIPYLSCVATFLRLAEPVSMFKYQVYADSNCGDNP